MRATWALWRAGVAARQAERGHASRAARYEYAAPLRYPLRRHPADVPPRSLREESRDLLRELGSLLCRWWAWKEAWRRGVDGLYRARAARRHMLGGWLRCWMLRWRASNASRLAGAAHRRIRGRRLFSRLAARRATSARLHTLGQIYRNHADDAAAIAALRAWRTRAAAAAAAAEQLAAAARAARRAATARGLTALLERACVAADAVARRRAAYSLWYTRLALRSLRTWEAHALGGGGRPAAARAPVTRRGGRRAALSPHYAARMATFRALRRWRRAAPRRAALRALATRAAAVGAWAATQRAWAAWCGAAPPAALRLAHRRAKRAGFRALLAMRWRAARLRLADVGAGYGRYTALLRAARRWQRAATVRSAQRLFLAETRVAAALRMRARGLAAFRAAAAPVRGEP